MKQQRTKPARVTAAGEPLVASNQLITFAAAARLIGVSGPTLDRYVTLGYIDAPFRLSPEGTRYYRRHVIETWLTEREGKRS